MSVCRSFSYCNGILCKVVLLTISMSMPMPNTEMKMTYLPKNKETICVHRWQTNKQCKNERRKKKYIKQCCSYNVINPLIGFMAECKNLQPISFNYDWKITAVYEKKRRVTASTDNKHQ